MVYQIDVPKIHCSGCVNLIKISLEEAFADVEVNETDKTAKFESNLENTIDKLNEIFSELKEAGYEYENLRQIN